MLKDKLIISAASTFGMLSLTAFAGDGEFYKYTNYNPDEPSSAPKYGEFLNPTGNRVPRLGGTGLTATFPKRALKPT